MDRKGHKGKPGRLNAHTKAIVFCMQDANRNLELLRNLRDGISSDEERHVTDELDELDELAKSKKMLSPEWQNRISSMIILRDSYIAVTKRFTTAVEQASPEVPDDIKETYDEIQNFEAGVLPAADDSDAGEAASHPKTTVQKRPSQATTAKYDVKIQKTKHHSQNEEEQEDEEDDDEAEEDTAQYVTHGRGDIVLSTMYPIEIGGIIVYSMEPHPVFTVEILESIKGIVNTETPTSNDRETAKEYSQIIATILTARRKVDHTASFMDVMTEMTGANKAYWDVINLHRLQAALLPLIFRASW